MFNFGVHQYESKITWRVFCTTAFERNSNGCVGELASNLLVGELVVVGIAFACLGGY